MSMQQPATLPTHDALSRLAREAPESFETLRRELIENLFMSAPEPIRRQLRQLQFRIDGIRRLTHSPLGACIKIQALMWTSFLGMNERLQSLSGPTRPGPAPDRAGAATDRAPHCAPVLEFRARRRQAPPPARL